MTSMPETSLSHVDVDVDVHLERGISETLDTSISDSDHTDSDNESSGTSQDAAAVHEELVEEPYQVIKRLSDKFYSPSLYEEEYPTFDLRNQETLEELYSKLFKHNLAGYFKNDICKEWNAGTGILTLRPIESKIREYTASFVLDALIEEIDRVANKHSYLQQFRNNFERYSRRNIHIGVTSGNFPRFMKSPDGQIRYKDGRFPYFVVEIGYRQTEQQVHQRMQEYMINGPEDEFTILAVNIEYALPHGRLCTRYVYTLARDRTFRNNNGESMRGELLIPFKLLLPPEERSKIPWDAKPAQLQLTFESLSEIVCVAEKAQRKFGTNYLATRPL
ncbi:hypothetical protein GGR51DRAFT_571545 [Nemania sp. FL0031]|nr:hypothetical protein GGR51DRAFT_571545 [Nemania sp. FL0031]